MNVLEISLDLHVHFQSEFDIISNLLTVQAQNDTIESTIELILQAFKYPLLKSLGCLICLDFLFEDHFTCIIICLEEAIVLILKHF